ncbi:MAG: hypothetical protein KAS53_03050 [Candidatus Cloacimonetes bacterium]|nr:hypothetical protein [Candidatus Cloacimonadota bacterium]
MKKLIIILLCIPFYFLSAVDGDPLDLGNIVIQGETESLEDTLSSDRNLEEYCQISSTEQFKYTTYYSPIIIESPITYPIQDRAAFQFKGGLENFTSVRGVISSGDIWNFSTDLQHHKKSEDWKESTFSFQWQPEINEHKMILDFTNKEFGETKISGGYVSYVREDLIITQNPAFSWDIDLKSAYNEYTQIQTSASDFDLNSNIGIQYNNYHGNVSANMLMQKVSGYCYVGVTNLKFFDEIGLWCAYDEDGIYPSINFNSKISLYKNLRIRFENNPIISTFSRADGFNENLLQDIFPCDFQTKKILNSFITLESDFVLPISIYYNANLERDHLRYIYNDISRFYELKNIDCLIHKMGFKAAYEYGDITTTQNIEYKLSEEDLYFEPLLISSTKLEYNKNLYRIGVDLQLLSGGADDRDEYLDNAFMIDISALYNLRDNISILAEVRNLLNQEYKKYNNYIADELQIIFGVRMTF